MKILLVNENDKRKFESAIQEAVSYLGAGKIIVYPTDTLYGLGCDAMNEKAVEKVRLIKKRGKRKPFSVIVKDIESIKKIAFVDKNKEKIIKALLPGAFTLILSGPRNISPSVTAGKNSIGVRIPNHPVTRSISQNFENPIITTSVNFSGQEPVNDPFKIVEIFRGTDIAPDLILDGEKIKNPKPSVAIDISRNHPQITRSGMMDIARTKELLEILREF
jgi:tRNA threonylcarbamoyl adenosine modification protein (Sua5/YciO/YrdC/YwlC family)